MEFKKDEKVQSFDGNDLGQLDRVVIDPKTKQLAGIVVRKGIFFQEDKVIPIEHIAETRQDKILLKVESVDWDSLPNFEETHYVIADEADLARSSSQPVATTVLWYPPPPPVAGLAFPGSAGGPLVDPTRSETPVQKQVDQNIPPDTVALKEGAKVLSADDQQVGRIDKLLADPKSGQVTHFVVSNGVLQKERIAIPTQWATLITEEEVHLAVDSKVLARLPAYPGE